MASLPRTDSSFRCNTARVAALTGYALLDCVAKKPHRLLNKLVYEASPARTMHRLDRCCFVCLHGLASTASPAVDQFGTAPF